MEVTRAELMTFAVESLGLAHGVSPELIPLGGRGSDRTYFRLRWNERDSAILAHYDPKRVENTYFADIGLFLGDIQVPVPRLIRHDPSRCLILIEDLGETDLWSCRKAAWETRCELYRKTLIVAHTLHAFPARQFPSDRVSLMEAFGPDLYRWERDYFTTHFVKGVSGIGLPEGLERALEEELSGLARRLDTGTRCLLHRDLQSQNVMVRDGKPFLIDFQGMRLGNAFYDLGSLLCDPYVEFSENEREELLTFACNLLPLADRDRDLFLHRFWEASAQRLMQALGAYGFLGHKKGLKAYLEHIPAGLHNLLMAASRAGSLPRLLEVAELCRERLGH